MRCKFCWVHITPVGQNYYPFFPAICDESATKCLFQELCTHQTNPQWLCWPTAAAKANQSLNQATSNSIVSQPHSGPSLPSKGYRDSIHTVDLRTFNHLNKFTWINSTIYEMIQGTKWFILDITRGTWRQSEPAGWQWTPGNTQGAKKMSQLNGVR